MSMNWIEILGYVASVLVAVSLTMSSLAKLRVLNLMGAIAFAGYGWLVGAYPVLIVNAFIAVVNVVYLLRMQPGRSEAFELLPLAHPDNRYFRRFLEFHGEDIARFFPGFRPEGLEKVHIVFILRNMLPVGVVVCRRQDDRTLEVLLDYVIPSDRDFQCARYFYRSWPEVIDAEGITRFITRGEVPPHRKYLKKMGFLAAPDLGRDFFVRVA
jgi:hypothetical protein